MKWQKGNTAILIVFLALLVGSIAGWIFQSKPKPTPPQVLIPTPTPTKDQETHSSDGTMNAILQIPSASESARMYAVFVEKIDGEGRKLIFATSTSYDETFSIPQNSWSPDNKYLYLQKETSGKKDIVVFQASGNSFTDEEHGRSIDETLQKNKPGYTIDQATGWMSATIVQIFTKKEDNTKGPTYWFYVPSASLWQR